MDFALNVGCSAGKGKTMRPSRRVARHLICLTGLLALVSTPLLAQTGIDLLDPEQVLRAGEQSRSDGTTIVRAMLSEVPIGVHQASHVRETLQYDDGEFENFEENSPLEPAVTGGVVEWAQRFELEADSVVVSARVCYYRPENDPNRSTDFKLRFYGNAVEGGVSNPGRRGGLLYTIETDIGRAGDHSCILLRDHLVGKPLGEGVHWVGVEWDTLTQKRLGGDHYTNEDEADTDRNGNAIHETEVRYRTLPVGEDTVGEGWMDPRGGARTLTASGLKAIGVSLVVETTHQDEPDDESDDESEPDPEDDVDPGPLTFPPAGEGYTGCRPTVSRLVFDGDYRVSLCYETAGGTVGEARAGIYKSSESGLLWFFDSDNAEALIKVLDGCDENGHRWVFMAAATDVAFNLYVTDGMSQTWSYHNKLGEAATTQTDNMALRCSQ